MQDKNTLEIPDAALSANQSPVAPTNTPVADQPGQVVPVTKAQFEPFKEDLPASPAPEVEPFKDDVPAGPAPALEPFKEDAPASADRNQVNAAVTDSANAVPQSAPSEIKLAGVNYSELVLVHATPRMPTVNSDGSVDINSAFHNAGGFDQKPDYSQMDGRKPQGMTTRASVHFTLQDPVSDHAYGTFEGREFTVYGRLNSAVEANGAPESLLTSDTAFFAPDKAVKLPDAVVVQLDLASRLNADEFARPVDGGWLVATAITEQNRSQAEQLLTRTEMNNPGLGALETLTFLRSAENGAAAGAEVSKTLALNSLDAPTINKAIGIRHGAKIGFDGWASFAALEEFKHSLPVTAEEKAAIVVGRHDSTDGDKLNTYFRVSHTDGLSDITQSKNPAIAAFAEQLVNSDLHQVMRNNEILAELAQEPYILRDDNGVSSRGMAASFFDQQETFYQSPKLGQVSQVDVLQAIAGAEPAQIQAIQQNLLTRGLHTEDMRNGDAKLAEALGIVAPQQTSSQPPLPGSPGALPSLGPDVPPPFPDAVASPLPPLPGSPDAQPPLGPDVPPPFPDAVASPLPPLPGSPGAQTPLGPDVPPPFPDVVASPLPPLPGSPGAQTPLGPDVPPPFPDTVVVSAPLDAQPAPEKTQAATGPQRDIPDVYAEPIEVMPAPGLTPPVAKEKPAEVLDLPEWPRRSVTETEAPAQTVADTIHVGARIGKDTPAVPQPTGNIDKDALLSRITREPQGDTVLYKLDAEPAFHDRGSRLEMVPGAGQSDEKVMAALLTAAQFYRGQIELTGSDAFKAKAIGLIAEHQINVTMKNPVQQMMLEQARERLDMKPVVPEAVHGVTPPPYEPRTVAPTAPEKANVANDPPAPVIPAPATQQVPAQPAPPVEVKKTEASAPAATAIAPQVAAPVAAVPAKPTVLLDPAVHQSPQAAEKGITGKVISCGPAPFRFEASNAESIHIKLRTKAGTQTFWGKELAGLLRETRIQPGKMATLQWLGQNDVVVKKPVKNDEGVTVRFEDKNAKRNQWSLALLNGPAVRTGTDEGVKLGAYDATRFAMIQNSVMSQLNVPIEAPVLPKDGLFWMTPNGQGSAKTGDELSAPRPQVDAENAGKLVMSSWSSDGHLDMALFRGDGPYLQGVVRQEDRYQHVLVSLPGHSEAPPMVFNSVTEQGLIPIGVGNGINRSGGEPVQRDHVAFKLEGDATTRVAKLDFPAQLPPTLHSRLGFNERYKDDNTLPKSTAPAAAPSAKPNEMRPA
ncbi:hypothetical protein IFR53_24025 [Pseudomonas syringae]|nr:hypothetical protein [Pseudomonas syringae]